MGKMWRRVPWLVILMGGCFAAGVWASDGIEKVEAFLRPDFKVLVDGQPVALDKPVLLYDDSSYVPLRKISELLNADVNWKEETHSIYINRRYDGQPGNASSNTDTYTSINVQHPQPYQIDYLGGTYVLVSAYVEQYEYYRVSDLEGMGVDVRGLTKSKDVNTGALYALKEDVEKLWKETPKIGFAEPPMVTGVKDAALDKYLRDFAKTYSSFLISNVNTVYPKVYNFVLIDAVIGHPGWFAAYGNDMKGETVVFMLNVGQNSDGTYFQKSLSTTPLEFVYKFFDETK